MEGEVDLHQVPLSALTYEARNLLSCLLNTTKILLSEGPDKLPRDWRGLASLINISSEIANSYDKDKAGKVIDHWIHKRDGTATIGKLLEFVQRIDRYDIFDDFSDLSTRGNLIINQQAPRGNNNLEIALRGSQAVRLRDEDDIEENLITFADKIHGSPQFYHAYILFAQEDRDFVDMMLIRMREKNFKMCTEGDILPEHSSTYTAVSRLISSDRCHRIVLVYSPDFLISPANNFYMDYAQAIGIEMRKPKIVPVMYRHCQLPPQVTFYSKLYYNQLNNKTSYDFWDRLSYSLTVTPKAPRINGLNGNTSTSCSAVNITEISSEPYTNGNTSQLQRPLLELPSSTRSISMTEIDSTGLEDSRSLSGSSQSGEVRKKSRLRNIFSLKFIKKNHVKE